MKKTDFDLFDKTIEIIGFFAIAFLFIISAFYYSHLPDTIPIHFNLKGETDGFGSKNTIWALPFISLGCFILIKFLNKRPHLLNVPAKITEENKEYQYGLVAKSMWVFNTLTAVFIAYINFSIIQIALGKNERMATFSIVVYITTILLGTAYYFYLSFKKN